MYDELERAAGARPRTGLSILGWIAVAVATLGLLGAAGAYVAYRFVRHQVDEVVQQFRHVEAAPAAGAERLVARTVAHTLDELGAAPAALDSDALAAAVGRALSVQAPRRPTSAPASDRSASQDPERVDGAFTLRTSEGSYTAEFQAGEDGGSLVVRRPDGRVVVDLAADDRGGRLLLGADGEVAHVEAGPGSVSTPAWLPVPDHRDRDVRRVVAGRAGDASFGAVTWTSSDDPERLVAAWARELEDAGWMVQAEHRLEADFDGRSASVVARDETRDRVALLAAGRDGGETRIVLGWGATTAPSRPGR